MFFILNKVFFINESIKKIIINEIDVLSVFFQNFIMLRSTVKDTIFTFNADDR